MSGGESICSMQARIKTLQATLASDSSQHAAAYRDLQQQHGRLQHEKEAAVNKGDLCQCNAFCL